MRLTVRNLQRLLTAAGYYRAGIDGDYGPASRAAVRAVLENNQDKIPTGRISQGRMQVMAAQLILDAAGFEPGTIDGYAGHNTMEAYRSWEHEQDHGEPDNFRERPPGSAAGGRRWPTQSELRSMSSMFGGVGENQVSITLPYTMKIAWNTRQTINRFSCHRLVAEPMQAIFEQTLRDYGQDGVSELRLDYFGGCLNVRRIRGGSSWSTHSWGIAVDLDPSNNQLRWGRDRATFARREYNRFWEIVESVGAVSLGRERNYDWMHWQFARL